MHQLSSALRVLGYVWFALFAVAVALSTVGAFVSAGFWGGLAKIAFWWSPFNVVNYLVAFIVLAPGVGALLLADHLGPRR